ncbi:MAG: hypothetical protein AAGI52_15785 [Bacteroidota bacterium]
MSDPSIAADLQRRALFLLVAAVVVDLTAVALLVLPVVQGGDVIGALPIAIPLFVVASGLFVVGIKTKKKADEAEA